MWNTKKDFLRSVCRCWCVHDHRNAGWNDSLPVVQYRDFINVAFPHVQPPSAPPSPSCITQLGWGDKKEWICMCLCIVFPVIITSLQKWTTVIEEGKSMRHPHLSQLWWKCFYFASRRGLGMHLFVLQLPWLELGDDHRYHSTKFSWSNLRRNFGDCKYPLILPFKEPRKGIWCNLLRLKTNTVASDGFEWKSQQQYLSLVLQNCWDENLTNFSVLLCSGKTVKRCKTWKSKIFFLVFLCKSMAYSTWSKRTFMGAFWDSRIRWKCDHM